MTMDTAGKAVLFSGLTVLISLSAVMLVPSPAFRSMALGIMVSVVFVLAAALTLLPAVLGWLGSARRPTLAALGALRRAPLAALRRLGRAAVARTPTPSAAPRSPSCSRSPRPIARPAHRHALDQGRPHRRHLTHRLHPGAGRVRPGRTRAPCRSSHPPLEQPQSQPPSTRDPGIAAVMPTQLDPSGRSR